jgi:hypothetical protein
MAHVLRTAVSVLAIAALLASGIVLCPCESAPDADAHACCTTASWRTADDACCRASESAPAADVTLTAVDDLVAPASTGLFVPVLDDSASPRATVGSVIALVPPPVPVLRI